MKERPDLLCQIKRKTNSQYADVRKQEEFFQDSMREIKGDSTQKNERPTQD